MGKLVLDLRDTDGEVTTSLAKIFRAAADAIKQDTVAKGVHDVPTGSSDSVNGFGSL